MICEECQSNDCPADYINQVQERGRFINICDDCYNKYRAEELEKDLRRKKV